MRGYLGLGSNIGDRLANLQAAIDALHQPESDQPITVLACSSVYETAPVGEILDQRNFFNACIEIETNIDPDELFKIGKGIEKTMGRDLDARRHSPRLIDIDILILGEQPFTTEHVSVPHRELANRRFVLIPLLDVAPEVTIPNLGSAADQLAKLPTDDVVERLTTERLQVPIKSST
jgi:2-amino-4-hydroxy-6-hydroxymethyldihydropteridine diphosphokinase